MKNFFTLVLISFCCSTQAQDSGERFTFQNEDIYSMEAIPVNQNRLIACTEEVKKKATKSKWTFTTFNKNFEKIHSSSLMMGLDYLVATDDFVDNKFYIVFKKLNKISIVHGFIDSGNTSVNKTAIFKDGKFEDFKVLGDFAYIFFTSSKESPYALQLNLKTGEKKNFPIHSKSVKARYSKISNVQLIDEGRKLRVHMTTLIDKEKSKISLIHFTKEGQQEVIPIRDKRDIIFNDAAGVTKPDGSQVILGTYNEKVVQRTSGMYFAHIEENNIIRVRTVPFEDLDFYGGLTRLDRQASKLPWPRQLKIFVNDIEVLEDGYLLSAQSYNHDYENNKNVGMSNASGSMLHFYTGSTFRNGIIIKFDRDGVPIWSTSIPIFGSIGRQAIRNPDRFIVTEDPNKYNLIYSFPKELELTSVSKNGSILKNAENSSPKNTSENKKVKMEFYDTKYWFGNCFVRYGLEKDKSSGKKKREFILKKMYVD